MSKECPRRLSYAGLAKAQQTEQKSRRVSDVGQLFLSSSSASTAEDSSSSSTMLHDFNSNTSGRYESNNKNRPARRVSRPTDDTFMCSQQSVLSAMERFVKAVDNMNSTVLVPSRLQDIEVHNENSQLARFLPPRGLDHVDIYGFFTMLKEVKNELLWGPSVSRPVTSIPSSGRSSPNSTTTTSHLVKQHVRQSSDDSLGSTGFPSDQETDSDIESVVTDRDSVEDTTMSSATSHLATAFRHHLLGLHTILHELSDSADYLSSRYQEEVDAPCV